MNIRGLKGYSNGEKGKRGEGNVMKKKEGVVKEQKRKEQRWSWRNLQWRHCPSWLRCLTPIAPVWLMLQEEIHPSVSLLDTGARLLLAGLLWMGFGISVSMCQCLYTYRETHKQNMVSHASEVVRETEQDQQACYHNESHLVAMVSALLDGLVVSLLQEPLSVPSLSQIQSLLNRLKAVYQAVHTVDLPERQLLLTSVDRVGVSGLEDRMKLISTYLQDRISSLHSLLQVQNQYGKCIADIQQELQNRWELLEDLHTKVTLQSENHQGVEDPHNVITDTESLYTQLGLFRSRVHECQTYFSSSTDLLQELERSQEVLAETLDLTPEFTWTKDFLQCNTEQFEKVHNNFMTLEQQTLTFVRHLHDLRDSQEEICSNTSEVEDMQCSSLSAIPSLPVYGIAAATEAPILKSKPEPATKTNSKLAALNCLRGLTHRR